MNTILAFIKERGFTVMIWGMLTAVAGIVAYVTINTPRFAGTPLPKAALALTIIGFIIYIAGRVSVAMQRRRNSYGRRSEKEEGQDDE
ncbi:MAG: hypothetical protein FWE57_11780 [Chitinispirillia bacterium]|nr:hypothetical protein [Chitinispirillia bacterium]